MIQLGVGGHHERDRDLDQSDEEVDEEDCAVRVDEWIPSFDDERDDQAGCERSSGSAEESQDLDGEIEFLSRL